MPFIQILFDSHPRPRLHPRGAAFIFFLNEEGPVNCLSSLFRTDKTPMESKAWGVSNLGQYTAHVLKLKTPTPPVTEWAFYQANIRTIEESANPKVPTAREVALGEEVALLKRQMALQQQRLERTTAEEKVSHDELKHLCPEVGPIMGVTPLEPMPGAWVEEPVSRRSGVLPRVPAMYVTLAGMWVRLTCWQACARARSRTLVAKCVRRACCTKCRRCL